MLENKVCLAVFDFRDPHYWQHVLYKTLYGFSFKDIFYLQCRVRVNDPLGSPVSVAQQSVFLLDDKPGR